MKWNTSLSLRALRAKYKNGFVIPLTIAIVSLLALTAFFTVNFSKNQDAKTFHVVNIENAKLLADAALEAATYKVRTEMNDMGNLNPVDIVKSVVSMLSNPASSWYLKMRVPGIVVTGGVGSSLGISGLNAEVSLSPDTLGLSPTWSKQTLNAGSLGITQFIRELGGDDSRTKVELTMMLKDMKPVVSDNGTVLWPGAVTDESFLQEWLKKLGNQLFDFLGINDIKFKIDLSQFIKGLTISIFGIPIPIGDILAGVLGNFLTVEIDVGAMLSKALDSIVSQLKIGDIMPIKADIVIEKLATLTYSVKVDFVPAGTTTPVKVAVEATRDVKVVDCAAPNPLYSLYWLNKDNQTYDENAWGNTGGGKFKVMNLNLDPDYKGKFELNDILSFFKGLFSLSIVRFPGLCHMGGAGKQKVPTGLNDLLLLYPGHTPAITMFGNYGYGKCFLPRAFFLGAPPVDAIVWFPWVSVPPLGVIGIVKVVKSIADKSGNRTQLFGDWCLSPPLNMKINGNVVKTYTRVDGVGFSFPIPFPPCMLGAGAYKYKCEEKGYSYSFFEKEPKAETEGMIENIYTPDQYRKKSSMCYASGGEFSSDSTIRDGAGIIKIDGVIYIEGSASVSGTFYGAGQLVVNGDLTVTGDIIHKPKDGNRIIPFSIICFGTLRTTANCRILSPVYAKNGVAIGGATHIMGNLVCEKFNPGSITRDLTIWYTPEITTCSFLSLIPYVGRYMPDRYRTVIASQYSTYKINNVKQ